MAFNKQSVIKHPLARSERLLVENIDDETVIYDEDTKVAHALKPLAAAVFLYADGKNSIAEIAELSSYRLAMTVTEAQVDEAVAELDNCALLDAPELESTGGVSRREALRRFGAVGVAAGAGTMLISSIAAPMASAAGLAGFGAPYLCGTGDGNSADPITGNTANGYPAVDYPQPDATSNWNSFIGDACGSTFDCTKPGEPVYTPTTGVCPADWTLQRNGTCRENSTGRTYNPSGATTCPSNWTKQTVPSSGSYQCVPCDGLVNRNQHYQCCNVVCVPNGVTIAGAITSKGQVNPYTAIPYAGIGYPAKYCTTNRCNNTGDCS
jgi:hypothetical protein